MIAVVALFLLAGCATTGTAVMGRAAARYLLEGDAKAGSAELREIRAIASHVAAVHLGLRKTAGRHPAAPQEAHQIVRSIMWHKNKAWLGIAQKKADTAFYEAGDVIKGYGRKADALVHEASGKIIETMEPLDELGAKIGGTNVKPPMDRR